jgi:KipI family sensor histidine kinase inhibitor
MRKLGDRALRIDRPPGVSARTLVARVRAWEGVVDAVVTERHVAAYFSGGAIPGNLDSLALPDPSAEPAREHVFRVVYDGPDLGLVAGLTASEVIELHVSGTYEVAMMGFAPGFAYLTGLDPRLVLPRRETPRPVVAEGSVAIGGPYTGIYPRVSPGGWHLLGRTSASLFDRDNGAVLDLGDRVRFEREP